MSADLHIHVLTDVSSEEEVKYFLFPVHRASDDRWSTAYTHISSTPNIWIGEVSWLKAALFEDNETFIPDPVGRIAEVLGEDITLLTEEVLQQILAAFTSPNTTHYDITRREEVEQFLRPYLGEKIFTVSW